ncbi:MAG TPA: hypothetical protein VGD75_15420, partial [Bradyrhizobium sp.]
MSLEPSIISPPATPNTESASRASGSTTSADAPAARPDVSADAKKLAALRADLVRLVDKIDRWNGRVGTAPAAVETRALPEQIAALAGIVRELEARVRGLEEMSLVAPRKPMRVRFAELLIGR